LTADFTIAKPDGETIRIWDSSLTPNFRQVFELGEEFKVNSADQRLVIPLGLPYFRDALARRIFNESGTYELTMNFFFNDYQSGHPSSLDLRLDRINFRVFGERFGLLGTDNYGRDIFSQVVHGTSISLMVGIAAALLTVSLSVMVGVTSAYLGGRTDAVLMRLADLVMALPALAFMIVIAAMIEGGVLQIVILLSLLGWAAGARNIRAYVLSIKESTYIEAAKAKGAGNWRIIFRHILPAVLPIAYAAVAIAAPYAIVTESELSYLGIGGDPFSISWGRMLQAAQTGGALQLGTWWWIVPPGAAIALLSLAFVALGHALDEVLNPRLRKRR
jgi:peptide/nickel transport system permease protein